MLWGYELWVFVCRYFGLGVFLKLCVCVVAAEFSRVGGLVGRAVVVV